MEVGAPTLALAYGAGVVSTLSPCVLPLLPILVASALAEHRFGMVALAAGLALSFTAAGLFVATLGVAIGIDSTLLHRIAGVLLLAFGLVLTVPRLELSFAAATAGIAGRGQAGLARVRGRGLGGQFAVGALLGVVWTPCVGPTLGAASTLATQGRALGAVAVLMLCFGLGAASPLLVIGALARRGGARSLERWRRTGAALRRVFGVLLVVVGAAITIGVDKPIEAWLVDASPDWLTRLTTRF